ncbi:MAG: bifunctional diguanylate cyclase/phosphodiesterase [Oceanospirillaceae bacterium]|nr:bifunctional diguanylate cyclase/phosphodiesterase [Oceanospirillaceae bacterium]
MKLNFKVCLIIVPIIIIGSLLVCSFVYEIGKKSYIKQEKINLRLQFQSMSFITDHYRNFSQIFYYSLLHNTSLKKIFSDENEVFFVHSIENNLTVLVKDLSKHDTGNLILTVMEPSAEVTYYFESQGDPFSVPGEHIVEYEKNMRANKLSSKSDLLEIDGKIKFIKANLLSPLTMKPPLYSDFSNAKSIIITFDMLAFDNIVSKLNSSGYRVNLYHKKDSPRPLLSSYNLSINEEIFSEYWLSIEFKDAEVEKHLAYLLKNLLLYTLAFIVIITFSLLFFITRNITKPILTLRKKILDVNNGKTFLEPLQKNDEISLLNLAYYDLYSQLKASYDDSQKIIDTDYLTKLSNRKMFNKLMERLIGRDTNKKISLLYIDIDNFKYVNDNYGHEAGDIFLVEFAATLKALLRPTDIVFDRICDVSRLAGDEFGVVIYDYTDDAIIKDIALRVISIFKDGFHSSIGNLPVSASIGISVYPRDGDSPRQLIINADTAMYQAKHNGKNQYAFFSQELAAKADRALRIELQLKSIDLAEFQLLFMPIIDAQTEQPVGVEALIRWFSAGLGQVTPDEFIPIAERKGYIKKIDFWVFKTVLTLFPEIIEVIGSEGKVSINISSAQLGTDDFVAEFISILQSSEVRAEQIILEITETFSTQVTPLVSRNLRRLKEVGFKLALDDFGSGYTTLIQLIDYPIDIVKIDKCMIDRIESHDNTIVSSLTTLCQANGYSVTAEGVENLAQTKILKSLGVNSMQGFYYCKPLPLAALKLKYCTHT